jgi:hypothetical protein
MTAKLNGRLQELEEIAQQHRMRTTYAVRQAALDALSDADLNACCHFCERLQKGSTVDEALVNCTPAETSAINRFNDEIEAAALKIKGRPLSRAEASGLFVRPGFG